MFTKSLIVAAVATLGFAGIASAQYSQQNNQGYGQQPQQNQPNPQGQQAPQVQMQRGQYFQVAVPQGFQILQESTNAIIVGSQQAFAMYGLMGLIGHPAARDPQTFAQTFVQIMQLPGMRIVGGQQIQPLQGFQQAAMIEFTYVSENRPCRMTAIVNTTFNGQVGNGAVHFVAAGADRFDRMRGPLMQVCQSISGTSSNTFGAAKQFEATRPRGDYGIGDWKPYDGSATYDRISRKNSDMMRGQDTVHSDDGTTYQPKWENYDPSVGGYRDPNNPDKVLNNGPASDPE